MKNMRTLSLFSGAGGLDIGFHEAGFDIVGCLEIDTPSCQTLELNRGRYLGEHTKVFNCDITTTDPASLDIGNIDFIIGGPPCQSFSAAGRRAGGVHGINDTRGSLFWYYCKFLEHFQPKGFLFENVKGILQANKSRDWEIIVKSFESVGYSLYYRVLDAADYGVPQHRERLIMVGVRNDLKNDFKFPAPTHGPFGPTKSNYVSAFEALKDLDDPLEIVPPYGGKYGHLLPDIPPGSNYLFYTEKMGHPNPQFAWRSKFSGFLYKIPLDEPSKTVVAHQGRYDGPFHWRNRKLTVEEFKRIQSFPDDYRFISSKVESVKQIGNSVAPLMARNLAEAVALQFFGKNSSEIDLIETGSDLGHSQRKAQKASRTKDATKKIKSRVMDSLPLFAEEKGYELKIVEDYKIEGPFGAYSIRSKLDHGLWVIELEPHKSEAQLTAILNLKFSNPAGCEFNEIRVRCDLCSIADIGLGWDAVHDAVAKSSSYDGLMPLYGHFTEPYPKFTVSLEVVGNIESEMEEKKLEMIKNLCDFSYLSKIHALSEVSMDEDLALDVIKSLRDRSFDIRTHETNRAIAEGFFKPCYPFSLSSRTNSYIVWRDKGSHETGDVIVSVNEGKVVIAGAD